MELNLEFMVEFIQESEEIENLTRSSDVIRKRLNENSPHGHTGALLMLREHSLLHETFDDLTVKLVQRLIVEEQPFIGARALPSHECGAWRKWNVFFNVGLGSSPCSHHEEIDSDMSSWIHEVRRFQELYSSGYTALDAIREIARLHWRYERIHPFADGNGRSGRLFVYYLYRWCRMNPFVFTSRDRFDKYYPCFRSKTPREMEGYFIERSSLWSLPLLFS